MALDARVKISRRSWLLAGLAIPLFRVRAAAVEPLTVSFDGDNLHFTAPRLHFLSGKPLTRLKEGATVVFLSQLTLRDDRGLIRHAHERLNVSFDVWEEKFNVVLAEDRHSKLGLTQAAAEAWCFDNLVISALALEPTRPFWLHFDLRVATERELAALVSGPGLSFRNLIEYFGRKAGADEPSWVGEAGPLRLTDLPRTFVRRARG
jgi:hypothetical protein